MPDPRPLTEKALMQAIIEAARYRGWLAYHVHDSRRSAPGFPDLILLRDTRCLAVEVKSARGRVSAEQAVWLEAFETAGVRSCVVFPEDETRFVEEVLR